MRDTSRQWLGGGLLEPSPAASRRHSKESLSSLGVRESFKTRPEMSDVETQIRAVGLKHSELLRLLSEIKDIRPALRDQDTIVSKLQSQVAESDLKLQNLEFDRRTHLKEHGKYRKSFMRRILYKAGGLDGVFAELAEKEQRDYLSAVQQAQEEQTINAQLKAKVEVAELKQKSLEDTIQQRNKLQRQLDELHESIFARPTPEFPGEDAKKTRLNERRGTCQRVRAQDGFQGIAVNLLEDASQAIEFALSNFDHALARKRSSAGIDHTDLEFSTALRMAEQGVAEARAKVSQLPSSVAFLPSVSMDISSMTVRDVLEKLYVDVRHQRNVERGREDVARCTLAINDGLHQAKMRKKALSSELRNIEGDIEMAKIDLQLERQRIFRLVLNDKGISVNES